MKMIYSPIKGLIPINVTHKPLLILKDMIEWTLSYQKKPEAELLRRSLGFKSWLHEYCTIRYALPRQSGHTTSAIYLAGEMFENPLFLVDSPRMAKHWLEIMKNLELSKWKDNIFTTKRFYGCAARGMRWDSVFVDCSFLWSKADQNYLYDEISPHAADYNPFVIVFLQ